MQREDRTIQTHKRLMGVLNQGRQFVQQLLNLFPPYSPGNEALNPQRVLAEAVIRSLEDAIAIVGPSAGAGRKLAGDRVIRSHGSCLNGWRGTSETNELNRAGESFKKRKGAKLPATTATITALHADDGYAWRKYGQKDILGSKYPRDYFRCTHQSDQGCLAKKHVQKLDDDSSLLKITYWGTHTCTPNCPIPELGEAVNSCHGREIFLNFDSSKSVPSAGFSISSLSMIKHQNHNEEPVQIVGAVHNSFRLPWPASDLVEMPCTFDCGRETAVGFDISDASTSGQCCFLGHDMDFVTSVEFDDLDPLDKLFTP